MPRESHSIEQLADTFKKAASALKGAEVPFMLGGGLACWARGGPETGNDLDFFVKPQAAERALDALASTGMRPERPPEDWLLKAWDGGVLVDVIFHPLGMEITDETLGRAEDLNVAAIWTPVMPLDDVITTKLNALLLDELEIVPVEDSSRRSGARIKVMPAPAARAAG